MVGKPFQKGNDPRRHVLTTAGRRKGYDSAVKKRGIKFRLWLRSRVATTVTPINVAEYKQRFLKERMAG